MGDDTGTVDGIDDLFLRIPWVERTTVVGKAAVITGDWTVLPDADHVMVSPAEHRRRSTAPIRSDTPDRIPVVAPTARVSLDVPAALLGSHPNYYHLLTDYLLNCYYAIPIAAEGRVVVVGDPISPLQRDIMAMFGMPDAAVHPVRANMLLDCSDLAILPRAVRGMGVVVDRDAIAWARMRALASAATQSTGGRRLYISREGDGRRTIANETALLEALTPLGFESHRMEALPFAAQARLFAEAEFVVGPHGAGLANLIFMKPGGRVIEIMPGGSSLAYFKNLATGVGLGFRRVQGGRLTGADGSPGGFYAKTATSFPVDPNAVAATVVSSLAPPKQRA